MATSGTAAGRSLLEYEGRQHAERDQFRRDIDRYSLIAVDGWLVLRFAGPTWAAAPWWCDRPAGPCSAAARW